MHRYHTISSTMVVNSWAVQVSLQYLLEHKVLYSYFNHICSVCNAYSWRATYIRWRQHIFLTLPTFQMLFSCVRQLVTCVQYALGTRCSTQFIRHWYICRVDGTVDMPKEGKTTQRMRTWYYRSFWFRWLMSNSIFNRGQNRFRR